MAAGDEDDGIAAQGLTQPGAVESRRLIAGQQQADGAGMALDDGVGCKGGGKPHHGDVFVCAVQHAFDRALQAEREIVLGGERFRRGEHALRRIEENRVGISAAGIEAEEEGQDGAWETRAGLMRRYV